LKNYTVSVQYHHRSVESEKLVKGEPRIMIFLLILRGNISGGL